jgi:hypothetical protein
MAERENGSSPLAEALARADDRWTLLVVETLLAAPAWLVAPGGRRQLTADGPAMRRRVFCWTRGADRPAVALPMAGLVCRVDQAVPG